MPKKTSSLDEVVDLNKMLLEEKFKEAKAKGIMLWPDEAIRELFDYWDNMLNSGTLKSNSQKPTLTKTNHIALSRMVHLFAVELFYRTYYPTTGAPKLTNEYLASILKLYREKNSYRLVALELDPKLSNQELISATQKIRKQVKLAQKKLKPS